MFHDQDDFTLELARIVREAEARVHAKLAAQQLGEAFIGLELEMKPQTEKAA